MTARSDAGGASKRSARLLASAVLLDTPRVETSEPLMGRSGYFLGEKAVPLMLCL